MVTLTINCFITKSSKCFGSLGTLSDLRKVEVSVIGGGLLSLVPSIKSGDKTVCSDCDALFSDSKLFVSVSILSTSRSTLRVSVC